MADQAGTGGHRLKREMGRRSLLFLSVGAIIGSGWLFAGLDAARPAGGSSVVAWVLAGAMVITLALVHAELGTMFPIDGGTARFPLYAFGRVTGFISGWSAWIAAASIAPIETEAALRYAGNYLPWLTQLNGEAIILTPVGVLVAAAVLLVFTLLNLAGLRQFRETNTLLVTWKLVIPLLVAVSLIVSHFDAGNFAVGGFFAGGAQGVLDAISTGGVIFALVGFEQAVELGGETRHPQRSIPFAVVGSVVIGGSIYLLLQVSFVGAMPAHFLAEGWPNVGFKGIFGPYAGLASALGATFIAYLVYVAAIVSPAGTGLTYTATSSRLPFALAREGYLPPVFARLSGRRVPVTGLIVTYVAELGVILAFRDWDSLLRFVTTVLVMVYGFAPLSLVVLRHTAPGHRRPYRLPAPGLMSRAAFCVANLVIVWNGWTTDRVVFGVMAAGMAVYAGLALLRPRYRHHAQEWLATAWVVPYLMAMLAISWVAPYKGGLGAIESWTCIVAVLAVSLAVFELALRLGVRSHHHLPQGEQPMDRWHRSEDLLELAEQ